MTVLTTKLYKKPQLLLGHQQFYAEPIFHIFQKTDFDRNMYFCTIIFLLRYCRIQICKKTLLSKLIIFECSGQKLKAIDI